MPFLLFVSLLLTGLATHIGAHVSDPLITNSNFEVAKPLNKSKVFVMISCSQKSGGTTLFHSFSRIKKFSTCSFHRFNPDWYAIIKHIPKETTVVFIDSFRDIISRKISGFFQDLSFYFNMSEKELLQKHASEGINFILEKFNELVLDIYPNYGSDGWKKLGYNCLKDGQFDFEKKFQYKKIENHHYINLRFSDIANWETILKSIPLPINLTKFKIVKKNIGGEKWYGKIYTDFLKNFKIPRATFETLFNQHYHVMHHFCTNKEIHNFIKKWEPHLSD